MPTLLIWSHASLFLHFNFVLSCSIYCQGIHNGAVHNLLHHWEGSCQYQGSQYWENLQHNQMSAWLKALTTTLCVGVNSCWLWLKLLHKSEEAVQDIHNSLMNGVLNTARVSPLWTFYVIYSIQTQNIEIIANEKDKRELTSELQFHLEIPGS
jgi:hypothetical protein